MSTSGDDRTAGEHVRTTDAHGDENVRDPRTTDTTGTADTTGTHDDRHDRDHDGRDDRLERDHGTHDDRRGAATGAAGGAAAGAATSDRHDRDHDGRDDRLERDHGTHDDRHDHRGRDVAAGAAGGAAAGAAVAHERDRHDRRERVREEHGVREAHVRDDEIARERFGGVNWGAAFFGWLVAVGMTALLTGIIAVVATAVGYSNNVTVTDAQRDAGTVTTVTALVLLVVLLVAYYAGGYVAGRMSRFEGGKQGLAAWFVGILITLIAAVLGWLAGDQYNLLDRVDVPRIPIPSQDVTMSGILIGILVLLVTLFAAMLGGKVGRRYHARVDRHALVDRTTY